MFKKAKRSNRNLRMAIVGVSGGGKTYTALKLASYLGSSTALIDTERSSAEIYSAEFEFDVAQLDNFHPQNYIDAINKAADGGYEVLIIDSLSHAWMGKDGALDLVNKHGKSFNAWGKVTPLQDKLLDTMLGYPGHIITTMRQKQAYSQEKDAKGKISVAKVGLATVQRDGIDFEFDVFGSMDTMNNMTIEKTRCPALTGQMYARPGEELAKELLGWLESGEPVEPVKFEQPEALPEPKPKAKAKAKPEANGQSSASLDEAIRNKLSELFVGKEIVVQKFMVMRGQIKDGETWQSITPSYANSILDKPDVFISTAISHIK
jgi:hypothetical protein